MAAAAKQLQHRTVWRWHFYAGLFCIPFILWLSLTGTVFLFHPQIQHWLDRPFDHLSIAHPAPVEAQVQAALAAVPGATLDAYQLPFTPSSAAQVLVDQGTTQYRVYVHPQTLAVLHVANEDYRIDTFTSRLHGELLLGKYGSWLVELAASWAVIMIFTGLFLWWPRNTRGLGGILYPRLRQGGRTLWKDIHAVTGIYVSILALFLLFTGLPWAKAWGGYFKAVRQFSAGHLIQQDWTTSSADTLAARSARGWANSARDKFAPNHSSGISTPHDMGTPDTHMSAAMPAAAPQHSHAFGRHATSLSGPGAFAAIDRVVAAVQTLALANPVLVSPPEQAGGHWTAKSDTRNRPLRVDLVLDSSGAILHRADFKTKPWLDRVIGAGIAAHEGQLFGFANQLLSLVTTVGLFTLSLSGLVLWWRRKPQGVLGAPAPIQSIRFSAGLIALMLAFGLYFPLLGASMILVGLAERFILRRIAPISRWLGLAQQAPAAG